MYACVCDFFARVRVYLLCACVCLCLINFGGFACVHARAWELHGGRAKRAGRTGVAKRAINHEMQRKLALRVTAATGEAGEGRATAQVAGCDE